jgi:(1->4)-alpha-D-glucan 1-alpha-D-glucosylmutase
MAKSLEDTAFYRYHRLIALNEVGNDPSIGNLPVAKFHQHMRDRANGMPLGLTATATHDTKRGEDTRMRILALSEVASEWGASVQQWSEANRLFRDHDSPTAAHEYMLYQSLVGAWPLAGIDCSFVERMKAYAIKAAREGKQQTSWINVDERYEEKLLFFVESILDRRKSPLFLEAFATFARRIALLGALNSLSQLALKATIPGVADFYQGTEFWDFSMVDPDNRRPVDFPTRSQLVKEPVDWARLCEMWPNGRCKFALMRRLLALRNEFPGLFLRGSYEHLEVSGDDADRVVAFARRHGTNHIVVAVGRTFSGPTEAGRRWPRNWRGQIEYEGGEFVDRLGTIDGPVRLDLNLLFARIPVAVLMVT